MTTIVRESTPKKVVRPSPAHRAAPPVARRGNGRVWALALLVAAAPAAWFSRTWWMPRWDSPVDHLIFADVSPGELSIVVTERGSLESQHVTKVLCEVDDIPGDSINGTPIVWIVPNGSSVAKGDLLVELDPSSHRERLDLQVLATEKAKSEQIQAEARHQNQITQNETLYAETNLKVELAKLELEMFKDDENGTHQLEVEEIKRSIDDVNNEILAAQANLELKKNDKLGIETLFKLGYSGKNERDRSRLEYLQAESQYAAKMNRLKTQMATLTKKETYERQMQLMQLDGKLRTAERGLAQVQLDNEAKLAQARAAMEAANESLKKEEERLQRYREQVEKCHITAPSEGMVAYVAEDRWSSDEIREGAPVRPRQTILTLPDLRKMQVKTSVHESVLDEIRSGLPARVRVEAFPDRIHRGLVQTVAVLPDQGGWMSSDTKVYQTIVTIEEEVEQIKPGMNAIVEIDVAKVCDVLTVPVQAVMQIDDSTWCYIRSNNGVDKRHVELGRTNDKFVEIRSGLQAGDEVVLNPMAILEGESDSSPDGAGERGAGDAKADKAGGSRSASGSEARRGRESDAAARPPAKG
ncbi:MAG: efflux RND transporter periplasmic adaptor subunit [Planctomycetes bacterium]|nr:efflux RND transporter periplasmic adaptor subunit [Planctomycetota bacterium]